MQYSAILVVLCLGSVYCQVSNLIELAQSLRLNILVKQLQATGIADTLAVEGNFTLFAPSDNAFGKIVLPNDTASLTNLFKYHVVSGIYPGANVFNEQKLTSLAGPTIRINKYSHTKRTSAEGARVYRSDEMAANGVIWLLDDVMTPPEGSMMDYINKPTSGMSILKKAIDAADFASALTADPLTLFAPNDAAFNRLAPGKLDQLLADKAQLKQVLQYHLVPGSLFTSGMHSGYVRTIDHEEQFQIHFSFFGLKKHVNNAAIESEDIDTTNGVIHVIDHVLTPPDLNTSH